MIVVQTLGGTQYEWEENTSQKAIRAALATKYDRPINAVHLEEIDSPLKLFAWFEDEESMDSTAYFTIDSGKTIVRNDDHSFEFTFHVCQDDAENAMLFPGSAPKVDPERMEWFIEQTKTATWAEQKRLLLELWKPNAYTSLRKLVEDHATVQPSTRFLEQLDARWAMHHVTRPRIAQLYQLSSGHPLRFFRTQHRLFREEYDARYPSVPWHSWYRQLNENEWFERVAEHGVSDRDLRCAWNLLHWI